MNIYTAKQFEALQNAMQIVIDDTGFVTACEYFRQICSEIGELIGDSEFKGGYDDMPIFYAHESYKTDKGVQLAIAWAGVNDLCKYEASKLGIGSPEWWYKCWEVSVGQSNSSSYVSDSILYAKLAVNETPSQKSNSSSNGGVTNHEPLYFKYELINKNTNEHFYFIYDSEQNIWFEELGANLIRYQDGAWRYIIFSNGVNFTGLTGCTDEYAKDIFPETNLDDFTVIKIPVYE